MWIQIICWSILGVIIVCNIAQYKPDCDILKVLLAILPTIFGILLLPSLRPRIVVDKMEPSKPSDSKADKKENNDSRDCQEKSNDGGEALKAIKILLYNKSRRSAMNIRAEVCLLDKEKHTTAHLYPDMENFISLPRRGNGKDPNKSRFFKFTYSGDLREQLKDHVVRVRVYAEDGFSGFGSTTEEIFQYHQDYFEREKTSGYFIKKK